jgi:hypothetical protein
MITTTDNSTVTIPESVTYIHAYGFGYLRAGIFGLEEHAKIINDSKMNDSSKIEMLLHMIDREAASTRALISAMEAREGYKV